MSDLLAIVSKLAGGFDRLGLQYALGGALASSFWGIVRTTQDIDCLVALPTLKYQQLADEMHAIGCRQLDETGQSVNISVAQMRSQASRSHLIECYFDSVRIEIFIPIVPLQAEILKRTVNASIGGREVPITSAEDLVLLKMVFHRAKTYRMFVVFFGFNATTWIWIICEPGVPNR
jgi:hypothetical protein